MSSSGDRNDEQTRDLRFGSLLEKIKKPNHQQEDTLLILVSTMKSLIGSWAEMKVLLKESMDKDNVDNSRIHPRLKEFTGAVPGLLEDRFGLTSSVDYRKKYEALVDFCAGAGFRVPNDLEEGSEPK